MAEAPGAPEAWPLGLAPDRGDLAKGPEVLSMAWRPNQRAWGLAMGPGSLCQGSGGLALDQEGVRMERGAEEAQTEG